MPQPKTTASVDFKAVRQSVTMLDVLQHYGLTNALTQKADSQLVGRCPFTKGTSKMAFKVDTARDIWYSFSLKAQGDEKPGGNILDFVAKMENTDIRGAALLIADWFNINGTSDDAGDQVERLRGAGYLRAVEQELLKLLPTGDQGPVVRFVKSKCLESYRNGLNDCRKQAGKQ